MALPVRHGPPCRALPRSPPPSSTPRRPVLALLLPLGGCWVLRPGYSSAVAAVAPFSAESLPEGEGWSQALPNGVRYRVLKKGEGDAAAGIFDPVRKFTPDPFVAVRFASYTSDGKPFHSLEDDVRKAEWSYQVSIRQGLEDEAGGVLEMVPGERRQFVIPADRVLENISGKLFGKKAPVDDILVDVTLLSIRPY